MNAFAKDRLDRVDEVLVAHVKAGRTPGLVALAARRGEVHVDAIGVTSLGGATPMTRDTIFRVASMSKPITAVAALILVEECRLRLDDPVDDLLPELANRCVLRAPDASLDDTVPATRSITLRDLLTFTWGLGIGEPWDSPLVQALFAIGQGVPNPRAFAAPDEFMRQLGALPLMHQPGERWIYNTGSDVLGVLIARASGQPFDEFLRERIFDPLGMRDTGFSVPDEHATRFTTSYTTNAQTGALELFDAADGQWATPPAFTSGAGGLVSTVDDFLAFGEMLRNGGAFNGERVLSRAAVDVMTSDHLTPEHKAHPTLVPGAWDNVGFGFGVSMITRRTELWGSVGAFGWDGGLGTSFLVDPAEELVLILLTNASFTSPELPLHHRDFRTGVYAALEP
jgi:CubicO group peptidase (beta-lactamase class C family)